jgi:hypothetical protein
MLKTVKRSYQTLQVPDFYTKTLSVESTTPIERRRERWVATNKRTPIRTEVTVEVDRMVSNYKCTWYFNQNFSYFFNGSGRGPLAMDPSEDRKR